MHILGCLFSLFRTLHHVKIMLATLLPWISGLHEFINLIDLLINYLTKAIAFNLKINYVIIFDKETKVVSKVLLQY